MTLVLRRSAHTFLVALTVGLIAACDGSGPNVTHPRVALLNALSRYDDSTNGHHSYCSLSGSWLMPRWPDSTREDTATLYFVRSVFSDTILSHASPGVQRDTLFGSLSVRWDRTDATHLTLRLGQPLALDIPGTLVGSGGNSWAGTWDCAASLPFAADSTLLANGYVADSLGGGTLRVTRMAAVD